MNYISATRLYWDYNSSGLVLFAPTDLRWNDTCFTQSYSTTEGSCRVLSLINFLSYILFAMKPKLNQNGKIQERTAFSLYVSEKTTVLNKKIISKRLQYIT